MLHLKEKLESFKFLDRIDDRVVVIREKKKQAFYSLIQSLALSAHRNVDAFFCTRIFFPWYSLDFSHDT